MLCGAQSRQRNMVPRRTSSGTIPNPVTSCWNTSLDNGLYPIPLIQTTHKRRRRRTSLTGSVWHARLVGERGYPTECAALRTWLEGSSRWLPRAHTCERHVEGHRGTTSHAPFGFQDRTRSGGTAHHSRGIAAACSLRKVSRFLLRGTRHWPAAVPRSRRFLLFTV